MKLSEYEESVIKFESARNEAMDKYFDARPQLFRTREKECLFEAGFRMALESGETVTDNTNLLEENERLKRELSAVSDLCRFMCQTYDAVDKFVYKQCDGDALMKYPVVQGTQNQINLVKIGMQSFDKTNIKTGVDYLLSQQQNGSDEDEVLDHFIDPAHRKTNWE
jgi:hypothetical protein